MTKVDKALVILIFMFTFMILFYFTVASILTKMLAVGIPVSQILACGYTQEEIESVKMQTADSKA